jgi:sterol 3beta-glucosyltransferase
LKITILTYGSRGDVEPFCALAEGLSHAGHRVCLAAPQVLQPSLENYPIEFVGLPGDPQQMVVNLVDFAGRNQWRMVRAISSFVLPLALEISARTRLAAEGANLILHSFLFTSLGYELARQQGIADISAQLFPVFSRTSEFPAPTFPHLPLGGSYRRLTHQLVSQAFWQGSRMLYNWIRRKQPQVPPLTAWPFDKRNDWRTPILYGFSPVVVPHPADWGPGVFTTGYWISSKPANWNPDPGLLDFIDDGPAPIAVAFGSTASRRLQRILGKVSEALASTGQRGILVGSGFPADVMPAHIYQVAEVPYDWLFPRSRAVLHHGGAGTTAKGLMAGVPNIVLPFTSDQPFWGDRVQILGAGPRPISPRRVSVRKLAAAIYAAVHDTGMRRRAAQVGDAICREDGVSQAVEIIEKYAGMNTN